jgi:hypothetical protein
MATIIARLLTTGKAHPGLHVVSVFGFLIAGLLGLWLMLGVVRSGRL